MQKTYNPPVNDNDFDYDVVDPDAREVSSLQFPTVMWRHGSPSFKKYPDTMAFRGGFFFDYESAGLSTVIPGWTEEAFEGDEGEVSGLWAPVADITIVRYRQRWFLPDSRPTKYLPWDQYKEPYRSQMQAVGFIKGYETPVQFSLKGTLNRYLKSVIREHESKVMSVANKTAPEGRELPVYACYMTVETSGISKAGKGDATHDVTMPRIVLPQTVTREWCLERYVGKERLLASQKLFHDLAPWILEWNAFRSTASEPASVPTSDPTSRPYVYATTSMIDPQAPLTEPTAEELFDRSRRPRLAQEEQE